MSREKGRKGEEIALHFLIGKQYQLLQRNYVMRGGEIDLVMLDSDTLVFVEVKLRNNQLFGSAQESISEEKCRRLQKAALNYLTTHTWEGPCRFDVIAIQNGSIEHWIDAI